MYWASLDSMARIFRTSIFERYKILIADILFFLNKKTLTVVIKVVIFEIFFE